MRAMKAMILVALVACSSAPEAPAVDQAATPTADAIVKVIDRGPAKVTLTVWPPKPTLTDPIYVRLQHEAPAGITITAPFQQAGDDTLGRFKVTAFTRETPTTQTYTLSAPTSGRHRVPPLRLEMIDTRGSGASGKPDEILTDEVPLEIAPVSTDAIGKPLGAALGSLDETIGQTRWWLVGAIALGAVILASGGLLLYRSFRVRRRVAKQRSAYEIAVTRLRDLETKGAPQGDDADRWFVELSDIVRTYLEGRYEIRAPELTTEEFLLLVAGNARLMPDHRTLLGGFLERCDRVKFAGHRPDPTESITTLASARGFVEDTRLAEARP